MASQVNESEFDDVMEESRPFIGAMHQRKSSRDDADKMEIKSEKPGDEDRSDKKIHADIDEIKVERAENDFDIFMSYMPQRKSSRDDPDKMEIKSDKPEYGDEFIRGQIQYWRQVNESEGFDIECVSAPQGTNYGLLSYDCLRQDVRIPDSLLVNLYARLGLHRYNFSKGTNLQLVQLTKFNVSMGCLSTYYITMVAHDPRTTETLTFQVKVGENSYGRLDVTCYIARPKGTPKESSSKPIDFGPTKGGLPYWPSDFSDTQRFYVMKESELQDNKDWIRLYLELALCTNDRWIPASALSQLQIVEVALEAIGDVVEPLSERFEEKNASSYVYIKFKGLAMARVGEIGAHIERKVIVRRLIDDLTGWLSLLGGFGVSCGEEVVERPMTRPTFDFDAKQVTRPTFDFDAKQVAECSTRPPINLNLFKWKN